MKCQPFELDVVNANGGKRNKESKQTFFPMGEGLFYCGGKEKRKEEEHELDRQIICTGKAYLGRVSGTALCKKKELGEGTLREDRFRFFIWCRIIVIFLQYAKVFAMGVVKQRTRH